ncbi:MAG: hypothetical protein WBE34_13845 [Candidatus Nitrosopolaris sp.]
MLFRVRFQTINIDFAKNKIYKNIVKPTIVSKGLECLRADDYETNEAVMKVIWKAICQAQVVVAEMTGLNPNVMYELGISHTYWTPTIMMVQPSRRVKFPFDISQIRELNILMMLLVDKCYSIDSLKPRLEWKNRKTRRNHYRLKHKVHLKTIEIHLSTNLFKHTM